MELTVVIAASIAMTAEVPLVMAEAVVPATKSAAADATVSIMPDMATVALPTLPKLTEIV